MENQSGKYLKPTATARNKREIRKCDMCKQYPKGVTDQYFDFVSAIKKVKLIICSKCKKRELK